MRGMGPKADNIYTVGVGSLQTMVKKYLQLSIVDTEKGPHKSQ